MAILSISLALITVGYLSLAAHSAEVEDQVEKQRGETAAYYASESGILLAEHSLANPEAKAPAQGEWLSGELPSAGTKFKVEVLEQGYSPKGFTVRSTGQLTGAEEQQMFEARFEAVAGKGFQVKWRGRP